MRVWLLGGLALAAIAAAILYAGFAGSHSQPTYSGRSLDIFNLDTCGQHKWLRFNDSTIVSQIIRMKTRASKDPMPPNMKWIRGTVELDPAEPGGWKFNPVTIALTDSAVERLQTTICAINENPGKFVGRTWYIPQGFNQYRVE